MPPQIDFKTFPSTRYQGSKRKILKWLHDNFKTLEFETVLDGFGGTGSVSYLLKKMGKTVTYNDFLHFNSISGKALIENPNVIVNEDDIDFVLDFEGLECPGFIAKTFSGYYYTDEENQWLDNVIAKINQLHGITEPETEYKRAICFHALFQACLRKRPFNLYHRKNLNLRLNEVERNFGNKTTWEQDFESEFRKFVVEINTSVFDSGAQCLSLNESIFEIENEGYDLVYLDPPYVSGNGSNETNDYLKCYHFLEGLVDYENWANRIDYDSKNLRFKKEYNPFDHDNILNSLDLIFNRFKESTIVLSYKIGGTPSVEQLKDLMSNYNRNLRVVSKHYKYALNKQNGNAKHNREILLIAER